MVRSRAKLVVYAVAILVVVGFGLAFQACFWPHSFAQAQAFSKVTETCRKSGRDPALLTGPRETSVGNARWAFEWIHQAPPRHLYGVWISRSGHMELYSGNPDDPNSAAFQPQ